ncbi:hypothetical protein MLOOGBEN_06605 [Bacillus sp. EB106-08-02-XG196]|uniref:hypothetical protein n=1 Tax=Bacillus sp. EB106-08-02-XG196 TaxID=2737049 RepID=UPI0015C496E8|nr:hypothetical protein [Bacillus sp. EB106-08-02-XG196]NWQ40368.1 hypothetical protein [Bacillus sp. EB106-08-02-XG196]
MFLFRKMDSINIKVRALNAGGYDATISDGTMTVYNNYGSTREAAEEMARYQLRKYKADSGKPRTSYHDFTTQARRNKNN